MSRSALFLLCTVGLACSDFSTCTDAPSTTGAYELSGEGPSVQVLTRVGPTHLDNIVVDDQGCMAARYAVTLREE